MACSPVFDLKWFKLMLFFDNDDHLRAASFSEMYKKMREINI